MCDAFRVFNSILFKIFQTTLNTWNATQMLDEYAQEGMGWEHVHQTSMSPFVCVTLSYLNFSK